MIILGIILATLWVGKNAINFAKNFETFNRTDKHD